MTKQEVKQKIRQTSRLVGAPEAFMLAVAHVETGGTFNPNAGAPLGKYRGVFQLSNGYGGCKDDQRHDVSLSLQCTWKRMKDHSTAYQSEFGSVSLWHLYGIHQQGFAGFKEIIRNEDKLIVQLSPARQKAIRKNLPKHLKNATKVREFTDYWRNRIDNLTAQYQAGDNVIDEYIGINYPKILIDGLIGAIVAGFSYTAWKKFFNID